MSALESGAAFGSSTHTSEDPYTWSSDAHRCLPLRSTALKCPWPPSPSRTLRCDKVWHMLTAARDDMHMETLCTVILSLPPDVVAQLQSQLTLLSVAIGITCTTMASMTCVTCKQACTEWTRLAPIVILGTIILPCSMTIPQGITCRPLNHLRFNSLRHDTSVRREITRPHPISLACTGGQDQQGRELSAVQGVQQDPCGNAAVVPKGASIAGTVQRNVQEHCGKSHCIHNQELWTRRG